MKGTGSNVGSFRDVSINTHIENLVKKFLENAEHKILHLVEKCSQSGIEYRWFDVDGKRVRLRLHSPDRNPNISSDSNSATGWIYRWQYKGAYYNPTTKDFVHKQSHSPNSPNYNPDTANDTHIPMKTPEDNVVAFLTKNN